MLARPGKKKQKGIVKDIPKIVDISEGKVHFNILNPNKQSDINLKVTNMPITSRTR